MAQYSELHVHIGYPDPQEEEPPDRHQWTVQVDNGAHHHWPMFFLPVVLRGDLAAARDAHNSHVDEPAVDEHPRLPHQQRAHPQRGVCGDGSLLQWRDSDRSK